jgi:hypothetical protein
MQSREHDHTSGAFLAGEDADAASDARSQESEGDLQRYDEEEIATKPWPPASN